jgi:predicted nucleic acid-binding Zn ribbon protein
MKYEYHCRHCGYTTTIKIPITKPVKQSLVCTQCRRRMTRVITGGSGVLFRGEDWERKVIK